MLCSKCGFNNPEQMKFCGACASSLERTCPKCNSLNPANFEFCGQCAHKLSAIPPPTTTHRQAKEKAERRQLTVLFCDIVNSSELTSRIDPEDLRDIMRDYRATCSEVVSRYDGHVAQHLGDGVLVYFGHPIAHEDDAQRATRAGLEIIERIRQFNFPINNDTHIQLSVRIGVHTGLVVIGEIGGDKRALALGDTPNIASRIQDHAGENTVIISEATYQLLRENFNINSLGHFSLKGFSIPIELFHVLSTQDHSNKADAVQTLSRTPLIGREQESCLLLERLEQARKGNGQIILLSGEPGLGKTRMVQLVCESATREACILLECIGSPYYQNSFFHPLLKMVNHLLKFNDDLSDSEKLCRIEKAVSSFGLIQNNAVPALSELLGIPFDEKYTVPEESTPQQRKHLIMNTLVEIIQSMTRQQFVLLIVEDIQWVDHSTIEFLSMLINHPGLTNIFIIFTFRSEFHVPWHQKENITSISLNHLTRKQSGKLIHQLCNYKTLPLDVFSEILRKTDGIPLYIEELTKTFLDTEKLREHENYYELITPIAQLDIPATLHDSLMSRLDNLGQDKQLAQLCSILGCEFNHELLSVVALRDEYSLRTELNRLINAEIFFQYGQIPNSHYSFRHALLCDVAYQSLLKKTRQKYHQLIATLIKRQFVYIISKNPEIYAHHCAEAGNLTESLEYWLTAGQNAAGQSANQEAITHYSRGLSILEKLSDSQEKQTWELTFQTSLGLATSICKGYAAPEVENAYNRARELCSNINDIHSTFPVLCGLLEFYIVRANLDSAMELGNQLQKLAGIAEKPELLLEAKRLLGTILFWRGQLKEALQHFEFSTKISVRTHTTLPLSSNCQDAQVATLANSSCAIWLLGKPDQALRYAKQALELAKEITHPFSQAYALQFLATIHQLRGEHNEVARIADIQITLSETYQFPFWVATGKMMRTWATSNHENIEKSTYEFQSAFGEYKQSGNKIAQTYFHSLLAQLQRKAGDIESAQSTIDKALRECDASGEKYFMAELLRIKGELLISSPNQPELSSAEDYFTMALMFAQKQESTSLALRTIINLYQLNKIKQTKKYPIKKIYNMLSELLSGIKEGIDTKDIITANNILSKIEGKIMPI